VAPRRHRPSHAGACARVRWRAVVVGAMLASFGSGHGSRHNFIVARTSLWRAAGGNEGEVGGLSAPSRPRPAPLRDAACSGQLVRPRSPPPRRSPHPSTSSVAASPTSSDRIAAVCSAWVESATAAVRVLLSAQLDPTLPSRFRPSSKDFWSAQQPSLASMQPAPDRSRPTSRNSAPRPSAAPPPATPPPLPPPTARPLSAASTNPCCAPAATSTSRSPPPTPPTTQARRSDSALSCRRTPLR
jgi:hypothetical protein